MEKKYSPPQYVSIHGVSLRLDGDRYFRDAGNWYIGYKVVHGVLISCRADQKHLDEIPLIEISKSEWEKENKAYFIDYNQI